VIETRLIVKVLLSNKLRNTYRCGTCPASVSGGRHGLPLYFWRRDQFGVTLFGLRVRSSRIASL
jgi:hypothetical protein